MKKINITCKGSRSIPIDSLLDFQGNLKTLERDEAEKLKRSILKHGFSFPVMVWQDHNSILDGHQGLFCVRELIKQGYGIGDIPIVEIQAATEAEAAEKLLLINSKYAKMTDDGLYEFLNEHSVDISSMAGDLNLPEIDIEKYLAGYVEDKPKSFLDKVFNESYGGGSESENISMEDKFPVTFILNRDEYEKWVTYKNKLGVQQDKTALLKIIGGEKC